MLVLDNVCVAAGRQPIIDRLSLQLNAAEMVGLIGPNGAGKSTLLHAIANLRQDYLAGAPDSYCGNRLYAAAMSCESAAERAGYLIIRLS